MKKQQNLSLAALIYVLGVIVSLEFGIWSMVTAYSGRSCLGSEKQALLQFKKGLRDKYNYLSSWVGDDCCGWHGIACNNQSTSHVIKLDLRNCLLKGDPTDSSLLDIKHLSYLDLSFNSFDKIKIPEYYGSFKNLIYLNLSHSKFEGLVPQHLGNLSSLRYLYLNDNYLFSVDSMGWLAKLSLLEHLDLSNNNFNCLVPTSIGSLTSLSSLDLSCNEFQGYIPESFGRLTSLTNLNLSYNIFEGFIPQSIGNLTSLSTLILSHNKLNGSIPHGMGYLTELTHLSINSNELRGCLPEAFCHMLKLEIFDVSYNQLSKSIPKCIGELSNLRKLYLFSNSWEGSVSEHHFVNLTRLTSLYISSKSNLVFNISSKWNPPFQLKSVYIGSLKVGAKFPHWLLTQRHIRYISMPNTSISDIPADWFVNVLLSQASVVDLSHNDISGEKLSLISAPPNGLNAFALLNNRLSGQFPAFICNLTSLRILVLSNNNFTGELPWCLGKLTKLKELDVMNNSLSGDIPESLGTLGDLTYLNLHNNKFQGKLPFSFQNLTKLVALDMGKNNLTGFLPTWTGESLPHLRYLILQSNNFYGNIPTLLCHYSSIQLLNLARNQITGNIPSCFGNFSAMITSDIDNNYLGFIPGNGETIIDDAKGYEQKYTTTLGFMFSIDLSNNNIRGEIPEELMDLSGLLSLNLAGNHLAGRIPDRIGKLKKLEFLDLSRNELYGPIPQSLSDLNFLSRLNLSFNDLSGRIPTGNQLQTLDNPSIYAGNNQLCGQPILKPCASDSESHDVHDYSETDSDSNDGRVWFYAGLGPGLLVGFLGLCASLHFIKSWRYLYFQFVEKVFDKIAVDVALLRRKLHN